MNKKREILIGVTGSISAYKACDIIRHFVKEGDNVRVIATNDALQFVGEATFRALTNNDIINNFYSDNSPIPHILYSQNCDIFLIAPTSANTIAKIANGIADNVLCASVLACNKPLVVAPAMNTIMYENKSTQRNLKILKENEIKIIEPEIGNLACGDNGKGRLASVDSIIEICENILSKTFSSVDE